MTRSSLSRNKSVRVLINGLHAKSGGGVTLLRNVLPILADDDRLEVHLALHSDQTTLFSQLDSRLKIQEYKFRSGFFRLLLWEQIVFPLKARAICPDVTFSPANYGPLLVRSPVIMLQNALAVSSIETRLSKRIYWLGLAAMTAVSMLRSRRVIAISDYAKKSLEFGLYRLFKRKTDVVHLAASSIFSPGTKTPETTPYLLVVADIYIQKNLHTLIEALKIIHEKFPTLPLKIAGRQIDSDYYDLLIGMVDRLGLQGSVTFLGEQGTDDLVVLYRNCAAFILPSTVESFGLPLVEAMACGVPVATSNTAAMPEIVGDGAILFDPLNPTDVAQKIIWILEDHDFAQQIAEQGKRQAAKYSWHLTARKIADILVETAA